MRLNRLNLSIARFCGNPPADDPAQDLSALLICGAKTIAANGHYIFMVDALDKDDTPVSYVDSTKAQTMGKMFPIRRGIQSSSLPFNQ